MVERKAIYTETIADLVDKNAMWDYLTWYEIPLSEALIYHLVTDVGMEKSRVAELLNVSPSRVSHACKNVSKRFQEDLVPVSDEDESSFSSSS